MKKNKLTIDIAIKPADIIKQIEKIEQKTATLKQTLIDLKESGQENSEAFKSVSAEMEKASGTAAEYGRSLGAALSAETIQPGLNSQMAQMDQYWQYIAQGNQQSFSDWLGLRQQQTEANTQALATNSDIAQSFISQIDDVFNQSLTKTGLSLEHFSEGFISLLLNMLQKQLTASLFSATANSLASPQSVATGGAAGIAQSALLSAAINAAFGIARNVLTQSFKGHFALGGIVNGPAHAQGGIKYYSPGGGVELEGGEAVINKKSTKLFTPLLSAINIAGGGLKFAQGGLLPNYANTLVNQNTIKQDVQIDYKALAKAIAELPAPVVTVEDINAGQTRVARITSRATL